MKIESLLCPCDNAVHPPDHYRSGACPKPPMPLPWLLGIQGHLEGDKRHEGFAITATRLLTCPTKVAIEGLLPIGAVDLRAFNSQTWGTAIHEFCQRHAPAGSYVEMTFPREGQEAVLFAGTDCELRGVRGSVDYLSPDCALLLDYKCHSESALFYKLKGPDNDLRAQFTVYKRLIEQSVEGAEIKRCQVWHGALLKEGGTQCPRCKRGGLPAWTDFEVLPMSDEELLAHRPAGGETTVREIVLSYKRLLARLAATPHADITTIETAIREELPLAGRTMWNQKMCLQYCSSRGPCDRIQGIAREGLGSFSG